MTGAKAYLDDEPEPEPQPEPKAEPDTRNILEQARDEILLTYLGYDGDPLKVREVLTVDTQDMLRGLMSTEGVRIAKRRLREQPLALDPTKSIGVRTMLNLPTGPQPDQLLPPFLCPNGHTILYGPGGVGKGMCACYFALELVRVGHTIIVLDFEDHEGEWGRRIRALGASEEQAAAIHYRAPFGDDWTAPSGTMRDVAEYIRADADRIEATFLIVDSFTAATSGGDSMGGKADAEEFFTGLKVIRRPSLTLAHVTGQSQRFPPKPYGSVFVHNYARETWAVEALVDDEPQGKKEDHQPAVIALELRNRKMNNSQKPDPQFIAFSFHQNGSIDVDTMKPKKGTMADWAAVLLARTKKPQTTMDLVKAIKDDNGEDVQRDSLRKALERDKRFVKGSEAPHGKWDLTAAAKAES